MTTRNGPGVGSGAARCVEDAETSVRLDFRRRDLWLAAVLDVDGIPSAAAHAAAMVWAMAPARSPLIVAVHPSDIQGPHGPTWARLQLRRLVQAGWLTELRRRWSYERREYEYRYELTSGVPSWPVKP